MSVTKTLHNNQWVIIGNDGLVIDDELDESSVNPVQNKVITEHLHGMTDHSMLVHRDYTDQHPQSAISNLVDDIAGVKEVISDSEINNL